MRGTKNSTKKNSNTNGEEMKGEGNPIEVTTTSRRNASSNGEESATEEGVENITTGNQTVEEMLTSLKQEQMIFMQNMMQMHREAMNELFDNQERLRMEMRETQQQLAQQQQIAQQQQLAQQQQVVQQQQLTQLQHTRNPEMTPAPSGSNPRGQTESPELTFNLPETGIRKINRRDSAVHRLTTFGGAAQRQGLLTVESDKHVNIIWENRTVDGFLKFFEDIDRFVLTYNQPIPYLFTHISENLQEIMAEMLYIHKPQRYSSKNDVFKASTQDIYEMAQLYFAPRDLAHFISLLTGACKKYEVTQKGDFYAPTRLKLYGLRQKFKERFEFLAEGAIMMSRREAIPAINYKQGGLLNIWTDLTPEGSRDAFKQMLINGKYDTLDEFLEKYFLKVEETNSLSDNIKVYKYRIGLTKTERDMPKNMEYKATKYYNIEQDNDEVRTPSEDEDEREESVFAIDNNDRAEYSREACPRLLTKGKCWQRDCRYSHKALLVDEEKERILKQWMDERDRSIMKTQLTGKNNIFSRESHHLKDQLTSNAQPSSMLRTGTQASNASRPEPQPTNAKSVTATRVQQTQGQLPRTNYFGNQRKIPSVRVLEVPEDETVDLDRDSVVEAQADPEF